MRIAIDARVLEKEMTGIGRYLRDLLNVIPQIDNKNEYFLFSTISIQNYKNNFFKNIILDKLMFHSKIFSPFWLNFILRKYLVENKFDLFFSPNNLCPLISSTRIKKIITIHDVMFKIDKYYYPFFYRNYLNFMLKRSINSADKIITISKCSQMDIVKYYDVSREKVKVIYGAADPKFKFRPLSKIDCQYYKSKYSLPENYALYIGLIENRKNINIILKVAEVCKNKDIDIGFILIGRPGYGFKEIKQKIDRCEGKILYLNYIDDVDLPHIYNLAKIFIFPSLYEGFGLPVLEAMKSGIPVLTSNTSSLPEIVNNYGIMHEPNDTNGFVESILSLLRDNVLYKEYCERSLIGAKRFNQEMLVFEHVKLFNELLK
ncbi:MAG: glycosyltransferase family 1 protein [Ignavibacteriaceae bacterium]